MKQNIYDNPEFFAGYKALRDAQAGLNEVLEQPALLALLPNVTAAHVLDLGCGDGCQCVRLIERGAKHVIGVDISRNMIALAHQNAKGDHRIAFHHTAMEDFAAAPAAFDLVVSSLAFHYVADLAELFRRIHLWLKPGGVLVFSMEHPIATCSQGIHPGWHRDANGRKAHWQVDCYAEEGERRSRWIVDSVVKYHRTVSSIINALLESQFQIDRILEPHALEAAEKDNPLLLEERRRPPFLLVKARKLSHAYTEPMDGVDGYSASAP
jgi:SAM-dependent methyltransferase